MKNPLKTVLAVLGAILFYLGLSCVLMKLMWISMDFWFE